MKKVLSLFMALLMSIAMFAQNDLMDWANEKPQNKVNSVTVEKHRFPLQLQDGKITSSGSISLPGKSAKDIFVSSMLWVVNTYPSSRTMFKKIDPDNFRFLIEPAVMSTQYASTGTYYKCKLVVQAKDGELVFQAFDITCTHLGGGLSLAMKTETFEELMPDLNPKKKKSQVYMEEFVEGNSNTISMMAHNSNLEPIHSITHWDKITEGVVVVGMTSVECLLAWGKPNKINVTKGEFGNLQQWVYEGRQYLYVDDGKLTSMQDF